MDGADAGLSGPDLPAGTHVRGQTWEVTAVPHDGEVEGAAATAASTVANAPPSPGAVVLDLDAPTVSDTLTATCLDPADGDGREDLGIYEPSGSASWLYFFQGPPSGTGLTVSDALGYGAGSDASHGDLDADGVDELVLSDTSVVKVYSLPLTSGTLGAAEATVDVSGYYSFYTAEPEARYDYSGDGIVDLLFGAESGGTPQYVLLHTGGNP